MTVSCPFALYFLPHVLFVNSVDSLRPPPASCPLNYFTFFASLNYTQFVPPSSGLFLVPLQSWSITNHTLCKKSPRNCQLVLWREKERESKTKKRKEQKVTVTSQSILPSLLGIIIILSSLSCFYLSSSSFLAPSLCLRVFPSLSCLCCSWLKNLS